MSEPSEHLFTLIEASSTQDVRIRHTDVHVPGGRVGHAVDHQGRRHLLIPLAAGDARFEDRSSRGVTIAVRPLADRDRRTTYLDVVCELPELHDLFAELCDEMLQRIRSQPGVQPAPLCRTVLNRWRELFEPNADDLLGKERLAGLLAELHFLEQLAAVDPAGALRLWSGPDRSRVDFTGKDAGVEVKATTSRERLAVEIHGLGQLDPGPLEALYLYVEQLEPVPVGGESVPDVVSRLTNAGVDRAELLRQLQQSGYQPAEAQRYGLVRFRRLQTRTFLTTVEGFPRLTPPELRDPVLAERISRVRYTIDLTDSIAVPGLIANLPPVFMRLLGGPA